MPTIPRCRQVLRTHPLDLGAPEWVGEELFDAVTALAGCGPAFVYRFIQALAAGGEALGLDEQEAEQAFAEMLAAAADKGLDIGGMVSDAGQVHRIN